MTNRPVTSIGDVLQKFNPLEDKYISREFQTFGLYLAEKLQDMKKKALYIKYAKTMPRPPLEQALRFVIDSNARNKAALFIWKLKEMGLLANKNKKNEEKAKNA